jgi:hypothetical protein
MGVDAEMFVRLRGSDRLTEEQVNRLSYEIGTAFDNKFFFTMNPKQGVFSETRRALEIMKPLDKTRVEDYGLSEDFAGKVVWTQDGDEIVAADDEQFIKVNLHGRYYGKEYERGDWTTLRACIFWLTTKIPSGQVWYGGDSSGCCAQHADSIFMAEMDRHWVDNARRPYVRHENKYKGMFGRFPAHDIVAPVCNLCDVPMAECGGSQTYNFYWCDGCGLKASKHANGTLEFAGLHEDYPSFDSDGKVVRREKRAA